MPTTLKYQANNSNTRSGQRHEIYAFSPGPGSDWLSETAPNGDVLTRKGDTFDLAVKKHRSITLAIPANLRSSTYTVGEDIEMFRIEVFDTTTPSSQPWRQIIVRKAKVAKVRDVPAPKGKTIPGSYKEVVLNIGLGVDYYPR